MFPPLTSQTGHNALLVVVQNVSWQFCRDISIEELRKLNTKSVQGGKVLLCGLCEQALSSGRGKEGKEPPDPPPLPRTALNWTSYFNESALK